MMVKIKLNPIIISRKSYQHNFLRKFTSLKYVYQLVNTKYTNLKNKFRNPKNILINVDNSAWCHFTVFFISDLLINVLKIQHNNPFIPKGGGEGLAEKPELAQLL